MVQLLKKSQQVQARIFGGRFVVNKPVASGATAATAPYSNVFYWSHAVALEDCEFALHPHQGFEIMTFVLEGSVCHFDTASQVWTPLQTGDFQVIQSGSGLQHAEKISAGTRSFQLWFDPDFAQALRQAPAYVDYHDQDFAPVQVQGVTTRTYLGAGSPAHCQTAGLTIRRLAFSAGATMTLPLDPTCAYTMYVLAVTGHLGGAAVQEDDALRIWQEPTVEVAFTDGGELFIVGTPQVLNYAVAWEPRTKAVAP
ncbi:pirin family protein [Hymenobacter sp. BRD67]|uniref:pirin family protein n=1 Tax=Hymenobacter sp. BRD67 TaxID=2675877 RepID=UPI0015656742|nr:pirin family protein [Hymenobacter sp. BRD67]QKG54278.1 pirin family protein [Hymenobacter sp. BRD67]